MKFLDQAKIFVKSGAGGDGCVSFRREKYVARGGPNGGDGGNGGHIIIRAIDNLNTLIDYRYQQHFKSERGHHGMGKDRSGRKGEDIILEVPVGTQVLADDKKTVLFDLTKKDDEIILCHGGRGGKGNTHFKTSVNRAPRIAGSGTLGEEMWIWLQMKLIADVGLLGMPNAGKSTFLRSVSRARPKVADYPFTTLHPQLGVIYVAEHEYVVADIPGLIEGAHMGTGLGTRFLGHVERCSVLLHIIDATEEDVVERYKTIRGELKKYSDELSNRPEIIALNKIDALTEDKILEKTSLLEKATGQKIYPISAVANTGVRVVLEELLKYVLKEKGENK
tara:strand:- start:4527 stop:5531 length:1005 start_codon:yes stop_codon:yes gene_type:complete